MKIVFNRIADALWRSGKIEERILFLQKIKHLPQSIKYHYTNIVLGKINTTSLSLRNKIHLLRALYPQDPENIPASIKKIIKICFHKIENMFPKDLKSLQIDERHISSLRAAYTLHYREVPPMLENKYQEYLKGKISTSPSNIEKKLVSILKKTLKAKGIIHTIEQNLSLYGFEYDIILTFIDRDRKKHLIYIEPGHVKYHTNQLHFKDIFRDRALLAENPATETHSYKKPGKILRYNISKLDRAEKGKIIQDIIYHIDKIIYSTPQTLNPNEA